MTRIVCLASYATRVALPLVLLLTVPVISQAQPAGGKKVALLVGVNQYRSGNLPALRYAERDVDEMAALLRQNGYAVTLLKGTQATTTAVRDAVAALVRGRGGDDLVLLCMAGHGKIDQKLGSCFCPQDADFTDPAGTLLAMTSVLENLKNCGAGVKLLLVDACRELRKAGERGGIDDLPEIPRGVGVLLSCSVGQKSFEPDSLKHGLFFNHVLDGLRGKAKTEDGEITWDSLREYVKRRVPRDVTKYAEGGAQVPHDLGNLTKVPVLARLSLEDALIRAMKFVHVPKGTFWMGGGTDNTGKFRAPHKQVTIEADFELAAFCVTQGQWATLMGTNPSAFSRQGAEKEKVKDVSDEDLRRFPVESVAWQDPKGNDVQEFLRKLNERERGKGWRYRLPREAEWEYACRGAATAKEECSFDFYFGKGTNDLSAGDANFYSESPAGAGRKGKSLGRPTAVGSYAANKLGLYDMHGNVWQWCEDLYDGTGSDRVVRGGCWSYYGLYCGAAFRDWSAPSARDVDLGFRLARVPSGG